MCISVALVSVCRKPQQAGAHQNILLRNQDKLVEFLTNFHNDRSDDEQFNDEKAYLIKQIRELKPLPGDGAADGEPGAAAAAR
ncbi:hypothetical protein EB796_008940 [Bugula neritina]|uniref:Uncharacterized protein n=1 Tax=Bugula neritina TaxID=10212 RepID=A0A7J7K3G8_BUGNE|nr:hypothetical protein EB796_008940 [Bugula neritina]